MLGLLSTLESEEFGKFEKVGCCAVINTRAPDGASEYRATQSVDTVRLSFAIYLKPKNRNKG